jgi:D-galactarolactone isomerase
MMTDEAKPRLQAPPDACDCHIHVFMAGAPLAPTATAAPPDAPLEAYLDVRRRLGVSRCVIVQPSAYGADNRVTTAALGALGDRARGVATIEPDISDDGLQALTNAGMRGLRFHMLPGGIYSWEQLPTLAAKVQAHGWHVQVQLDGRTLVDHADKLAALPGLAVIDHVGKFLEPVDVNHPAFKALLRLVDSGRVYVKLSAPYEVSKAGPPHYEDVGALARALVRAAPERMLWASNWPFVGIPKEKQPDAAAMLDLLLEWADDDATRNRILVDNPARVYGF